MNKLIVYHTPSWLTAFTTGKGSGVEALGFQLEELALPRQVHSDNVLWMHEAGRPEATDAVITDQPGLPVCVKTADCIPVLLYDTRQRIVAAVHAGWRGTVSRIVQKTVRQMHPLDPKDLHAIIGPGISLQQFEVGDEVYDAFFAAGFPMERIARCFPSSNGEGAWHIDLWEANRFLLQELGVDDIFVEGTCTRTSEDFYSARRETINTGRNYNGIVIKMKSEE
ncbi:MAG: peptidoglycan editing factor PgeF [Bacteroidaceae bacterium]|nr:peptidoglycan editing factor PgeF [Bacteroidaceae bacterium]